MEKIYTLSLLVIGMSLQAQVQFTKLESGDKSNPMDISYLVEPEMVKGTPLGFDEWKRGRVVNTSGDTSDYYLVNYHTLGDVVYFKTEGTEELYKTDEASIAALLIDNDKGATNRFERVLWQNFAEFPENARICQVLFRTEGFDLIKYYDKVLEEYDDRENIQVSRIADMDYYDPKVRYFWRQDSDGQYEEIDFGKNWLRDNLDREQQKLMKDYQKQTKVRWNREEEVIAMLASIL